MILIVLYSSKNREEVAVPVQITVSIKLLLVVISIVSILIAILLPALAKARETSRQLQCATMQRQFTTAAMLYMDDNRRASPTAVYAYAKASGNSTSFSMKWPGVLMRGGYMKMGGATNKYVCSTYDRVAFEDFGWGGGGGLAGGSGLARCRSSSGL